MKVIIGRNELDKFRVNKYKFKLFGSEQDSQDEEEFEPVTLAKDTQESAPEAKEKQEPQTQSTSSHNKDELIESLLKKTDEISSNFIKVQMKLEQSEQEHKTKLEQVQQEYFEKGIAEGKERQIKEYEKAKASGIEQFASSVKTLNDNSLKFEEALKKIKDELIHAALDIAKEVIKIDVGERSSEIALKLSQELVKELQEASKITLKVNPNDHGAVSEKIGKLENIDIVSDSAVSPGGVIAISDAGNIDSDLMKRYEKVKEAALK